MHVELPRAARVDFPDPERRRRRSLLFRAGDGSIRYWRAVAVFRRHRSISRKARSYKTSVQEISPLNSTPSNSVARPSHGTSDADYSVATGKNSHTRIAFRPEQRVSRLVILLFRVMVRSVLRQVQGHENGLSYGRAPVLF